MPLPRVAIVGRPNVGKSSLMNMIAGAKVSIVDPTAGTTRDRVTAIVDLVGPTNAHPVKTAEFVDTGGFGVYVEQGARFDEVGADLAKLTDSIEFQISQAVGDADLILFCVDAQQGVTAADRDIARLLRERRLGPRGSRPTDTPSRTPAPIRVVATKVDGPKWEAHAPDLANLGFGEPIAVSSKTNYFRRDFLEAVYDLLPETAALEPEAPADLKIAIVGKRNSGKSTLVNTLAGQERVIVSEIAGTTRDAVDVRFELDGRSVVAIDTAGLRRKRSFQNMIEHYAFDRLQRSIDRADVVLLLLDATEKVSQVDEQLAQLIQRAYKPAIICVNKWDLVEGARDDKGRLITPETYEKYLRAELGGLTIAPISFMSASSGVNAAETIDLAFDLKTQTTQRVTTGVLNRIIRGIVDRQGPSDTKGTRAKVYYVAQTGVEPPTITLVVNHPQLFRPQYLRFLMNRLREELPFTEVPIRLVVRARRQREDDLATAGEDGPARVTRGRKGEDIRARRERAKTTSTSPESPEGDDSLLDDANSEAVDVDAFDDLPDNAAEYFDDR